MELSRTAALCLAAVAFGSAPSFAANLDAGKARAQSVCAACHGANGQSVADDIPNLAGQRAPYLEGQLRALKAGTRKAAAMNAMAAQLGNDDIADVAAYFASLTPASAAARSDYLPAFANTEAKLPADYPSGFTQYQTVNRPDLGQVRFIFANAIALRAAREGKPLPDGAVLVREQHAAKLDTAKQPVTGADGFYQAERLLGYSVMERGPGWGKDFPDMLRNGDWNYASLSAARQPRAGVNQADCLACHKPLDQQDFAFGAEALTRVARQR
jgi:cytochrome c553